MNGREINTALQQTAKKHSEGFTAPEETMRRLIEIVNGLSLMSGVRVGVSTENGAVIPVKHYTPNLIDNMHRALEALVAHEPRVAEAIWPGVSRLLQMSRVSLSTLAAIDGSQDVEDNEPPPAQTWPKKCPSCSRVLNAAGWQSLQFAGYVGCVRSNGKRYAVELRHCICTSTIGIQVELPMAQSMAPAPLPVLPTVAENAQAAAVTVFAKREAAAPAPSLDSVIKECLKNEPEAQPVPPRDGPSSMNPHPCSCGAGNTPAEPHASACTSWVF